MTHLDIVLHEHGGEEFSDFNDNWELEWYEAIKDQIETEEACKGDLTVRRAQVINVCMPISVAFVEGIISHCKNSCHCEHQDEIKDKRYVDLVFQRTLLSSILDHVHR